MKEFSLFKFQFSSHGVTLIELLIVFAISGMVTLFGITGFFSYSQTQSFEASVTDVKALLFTAKSRALTQVKPSVCASQSLEGYQVSVVPSSVNYQLEVRCGGTLYTLETNVLSSQVQFSSGSTRHTFFAVATGTVSSPSVIGITGFGKSKNITVAVTGNISVR